MRRNTRRRPTGPRRATFAAVALILGGSGLVAANVYASATEGDAEPVQQTPLSDGTTIGCPDVGAELTEVPEVAKAEVDTELAALDQQIAEAYQRLRAATPQELQDDGFAEAAVMKPLEEKRTATIERIVLALGRGGERPEGLEALAACELAVPEGQQTQEGQGGDGQQQGNGPVAEDFADITAVQPNVQSPPLQGDASRGTFVTSCGVNENGLFNSDNVIVAPGVSNGAHHFHDYIGNQANDAFASDEDLAAADTSCENPGDKSSYYWPVLRLQNGTQERDADAPGGGIEGNTGEIVTPAQVTLTFEGSPRGEVTAMPRLLRIITGDAKAFVNGTANANASWSCTGFEDRQLKDKYPLCPEGSDVVRTFRFQSCWDGRNIDSANHRTHVAFAAADGSCPAGFRAIPQLVQRIVYDVDAPSVADGGRTIPFFAVDSFPEQLHKPVTDHGDFINVFDEDLMREMVDCINEGRQCDAGAAPGEGPGGGDTGGDNGGDGGNTGGDGGDGGGDTGGDTGEGSGGDTGEGSGEGSGGSGEETQQPAPADGNQQPGKPQKPAPTDGGQQAGKPQKPAPADEDPAQPAASESEAAVEQPKAYTSPSPTGTGTRTPGSTPAEETPAAAATPSTAPADDTDGTDGTEPQTVGGGLADTGATLWPAAAGAVLFLSGIVLLRRIRKQAG
ncbi:DUF1996 domain-containing protein [Streptomyces sp. TRM68416]|uniref:DUF1996 domain-containing protein n=1 Tax=Streptomyces sp. TRM68416 TaxID=2758412 RepID=UPI001CB6F9A7|nr:DUF1996 domain-containing protein [Streptomyces sp. TRM68416]